MIKNMVLVTLAVMMMLLSCSKQPQPLAPDYNEPFIGTWVQSDTDGEILIFQKADQLSDCRGYIFRSDGSLIERTIAGWCATPPVVYENYRGNWTTIAEDLIEIEVDYWGGRTTYKLQLISVDNLTLKVKYVSDQ
ncbi:MAG: hypothetical protein Kow00108_25440 [Calditrichia bacterium]